MPPSIKAENNRKKRFCPLCDARPRSGKAFKFHLGQAHPESLAPDFWHNYWLERWAKRND